MVIAVIIKVATEVVVVVIIQMVFAVMVVMLPFQIRYLDYFKVATSFKVKDLHSYLQIGC